MIRFEDCPIKRAWYEARKLYWNLTSRSLRLDSVPLRAAENDTIRIAHEPKNATGDTFLSVKPRIDGSPRPDVQSRILAYGTDHMEGS